MKSLIQYLSLLFISLILSIDNNEINGLTSFYFGIGSSIENGSNINTETPWTMGGTFGIPQYNLAFGCDIAFEGTSYSSTYARNNYPEQSISLNFIVVKNIFYNDKWRIDTGPLIGFRDKKAYCTNGDSYLGYACYADASPSYDHTGVFGGLFMISNQSLSLGLRLTDVSQQLMIAYNMGALW